MFVRERERERDAWIDFARALSTLAVILCHASEAVYTLNLPFMSSLTLKSRIFGFSAFTLGRLGVPVFLMISGYLLLDREYTGEKTVRFWKKNCLHLFICTEIWLFLYAVFNQCIGRSHYTFSELIEVLLFVRSASAVQLWYMPMILGIYLLIPFIANGIRSVNPRHLLFPILVFATYSFVLPTLNVVEYTFGGNAKGLTFFTQFSGGAYGLYCIIGYTIKKGCLKQIKSIHLLIFSALMFATTVAFQLMAYHFEYSYNVWYDNLFLFMCSVSLFELASRIRIQKNSRAISMLSYYSFPVYLIHSAIRTIMRPQFSAVYMHNPTKVVLLFACVTAFSLPIGMLISKIPKVGKYILYLK